MTAGKSGDESVGDTFGSIRGDGGP